MDIKASESKKVRKVRKKLEQIIKEEHRELEDPKSINKVKGRIESWINRHQSVRISSVEGEPERNYVFKKEKPAEIKSKFVMDLMKQLQNEKENDRNALKGRISPQGTSETATQN